ncbi:RelA/SpoT family protein [Actinomadura atramentaria]|uniref:RelA/SpoT family protein n=1 Tax=Actinomadura atramentaria TaxID=1990 RepID=UPI0003A29E4D|nr:HD domain-containing protein [Actinomadura atramentaria]
MTILDPAAEPGHRPEHDHESRQGPHGRPAGRGTGPGRAPVPPPAPAPETPDPADPAPLLAAHRAARPGADLARLARAHAVAERMHRGQLRRSGEPFITHPLAVAAILADLGLDTTTLVAALLHDTVEDTPYTLAELRDEFGDEVAVLVDGVTKLDGRRWGERAEAETYRKIVLAAAADLRVLVIKLADRLHNLRTLGHQPPHKRARIARASRELYVPFAERLGIHVFRREMDDLAFAAADPAAHAATDRAVRAALRDAGAVFGPALARVRSALAGHGVRGRVTVRHSHLYAVHQASGGDLAGLRPCQAARLLLVVDGGVPDCYIALGAVHAALHPIPGQVRDHIATPKDNLYRSLHSRVITPDGDAVEVIIRNRAMHPVAEHGIIAHIRAAPAVADAVAGRRDLEWLGRLLAWQAGVPSERFLEGLRAGLTDGNVAVFAPCGQIVTLPAGATVLDFAYALGPATGDHCIGALVNGRQVPLAAEVRTGRVVRVLTDPSAAPSPEWLDFAVTASARVRARSFAERRGGPEAAGRGLLARALAARPGRPARRREARAPAARADVRTDPYDDPRADLWGEPWADLAALEARGDALAVARALGHAEPGPLYRALGDGSLPLSAVVERFPAR